MSDDKNTDDFSWLRGDDPQGDQPDEDGDLFGWDEPGADELSGDSLGFTGDLAWRGGESDGEPADASAGFGLTGQLPWMRRHTPADEPDADADDASGDDLDWLRGTEDDLLTGKVEPPPVEPAAEPEKPRPHIHLPDWLDDSSPDDEPEPSWEPSVAAETPAEPDDSGLPDWLLDDDDEAAASPYTETPAPEPAEAFAPLTPAAPEPDDSGLPDWLLDDDGSQPAAAADLPLLDDTGALSKAWLKTGELLPDSTDSSLTFDEWAAQQAEAERVPDIEEHLPEFGFGPADAPAADAEADPGTGELPDWFLGLDELDTSAAPDWFTGEAPLPADPVPPARPASGGFDDGFFDAETETPEPADTDFDLDALFGSGEAETAADWFAEEPAAAQPDWLDSLGTVNLAADASAADMPEPELADLGFLDDEPQAAASVPDDDIDTMLAGFDSGQVAFPAAGLDSDDLDFDTFLDDPDADTFRDRERAGEAPLAPDAPDWLTEMGATVGGVSAAALVRQSGEDRPLDELPDRLQRLRARSENVLARQTSNDPGALAELLPGVDEVLAPAPPAAASAGLTAGLLLTPDQRSRAALLQSLAGSADDDALTAALPVETGFLADEDDFPLDLEYQETPASAAEETYAPTVRRPRPKPARLLIALLVGAAVILPFLVPALRIGELPPTEFAAGSGGRAVFETLDRLRPGDLVLVGIEYGPTAAGELDDLTTVLMRHILARRALPIVAGTNPVGVLRADLILRDLGRADSPFLAEIGRSTPLRANVDYFVVRYLPAAGVGLRALGLNTAALLATDVRGQPTGLAGTTLADFAAGVLIGERPEDLRAWAEQIAPLTDAPLLAASGFSAAPLLEPYVGPAFVGLLVGFPDAYTYAAMLTAPGVRQPVPDVTEEAPIGVPEATDEPAVVPTTMPTFTPTPALQTAVIFSSQSVNVRQGPGADSPVVTSAEPGAEVDVLAQNDDGLWTQIRLPDGVEGWVSTSLLRLRPVEDGAPTAVTPPTTTPAPTLTPPPTGTSAPTATTLPTDTPAPTSTGTPVPTATAPASATPRPSAVPATPTAAPAAQVTAIVIASQGVNVRSGPGTTFQPVGSLPTGAQVEVIGRSGDAGWIQVRLDDGREGWISAPLLQINAPEGSSSAPGDIVVVMADGDLRGLLRQDAPPASAPVIPYAAERWYGMNLGLLVIVLIILAGAVLNTARSILRRRR